MRLTVDHHAPVEFRLAWGSRCFVGAANFAGMLRLQNFKEHVADGTLEHLATVRATAHDRSEPHPENDQETPTIEACNLTTCGSMVWQPESSQYCGGSFGRCWVATLSSEVASEGASHTS